jgi:Na+/H+-translocating membrane pyrophosphatase
MKFPHGIILCYYANKNHTMKKQIKISLSVCIIILLFNNSIYAQTSNGQQQDTSAVQPYQETQQQDSTMQQSVTISEPSVTKTTENTSANYRPTEKIRIYSGRHEGNNVIKTVEIPLPANSLSRSGDYVPH